MSELEEMGNDQLVEAYNQALQLGLDNEFVQLLKQEMIKRGLLDTLL